MAQVTDLSSTCFGVRTSRFPRTANIVIAVLAAFVVIVNSLAMISVLKNYRKLRQRIYVFVISLAAADILGGIIFLTDVLNNILVHDHDDNSTSVIFHGNIDQGEKYIQINSYQDNLSQELLETFKVGVVILSVLNIALVTFALYKRTTSMGRHHEDFKNINTALGPDGVSFLPAFDTMMRVLSIGSPAVANGWNKNMGRGGQMTQTNGDSPNARRTSVGSRVSNTSHQIGSSFSKEAGTVLLENYQDERGTGARKPPIVKSGTETPNRKSNVKRNASVGRLINNTGRRVSHAFRGRSASGAQSYVGRHSYSVMSKGATGCSLFLIWLLFAVTCTLPLILRRAGNANVVCPERCHPVELLELRAQQSGGVGQESTNRAHEISGLLGTSKGDVTKNNSEVQVDTAPNENESIAVNNRSEQFGKQPGSPNSIVGKVYRPPSKSGIIPEMHPRRTTVDRSKNLDVTGCAPKDSFQFYCSKSNEGKLDQIDAYSLQEMMGNTSSNSGCSSCSAAFYPLSKSHVVFTALVISITWFWLIVSASRLLYLRKHSTNVFVRCSALWRFMFMTALFFLVTLAPYIAWIILDFATASSAKNSDLWYTSPPGSIDDTFGQSNTTATSKGPMLCGDDFSVHRRDSSYFYPPFGVTVTCLLLVNLLVAPSLYLIRLLGFRRVISAL